MLPPTTLCREDICACFRTLTLVVTVLFVCCNSVLTASLQTSKEASPYTLRACTSSIMSERKTKSSNTKHRNALLCRNLWEQMVTTSPLTIDFSTCVQPFVLRKSSKQGQLHRGHPVTPCLSPLAFPFLAYFPPFQVAFPAFVVGRRR